MNASIAVMWGRLDTPGHDACRFMPGKNGWALRGSAIFLAGKDICQFRYEVLPQRYKCISATEYEYEAPTLGYSGKLEFAEPGVIAHYPGLFNDVRRYT